MVPVINLRNEPKLHEAFEYAHVHGNTVLIDRRTKWGNPFRVGRDGSREEVIARYRADLWRRIRAGEIAMPRNSPSWRQLLVRVLVSIPRHSCHGRGAGPRRGLGRQRPG